MNYLNLSNLKNIVLIECYNFFMLTLKLPLISEVIIVFALINLVNGGCYVITQISADLTLIGNLFVWVIIKKFTLQTTLGKVFPFLVFCTIFLIVQIFIISAVFTNTLKTTFKLDQRNKSLMERLIVFVISIPVLLFGFILLVVKNSYYKGHFRVAGFLGLTNEISNSKTPLSITIPNRPYNDFFHKTERIRLAQFNSFFNSKGQLSYKFANFINNRIDLENNRLDIEKFALTVDAAKALAFEKFGSLSFLLRTFPDGFVEQELLQQEGVILFNNEDKTLFFSKSNTVVNESGLLELIKAPLLEILENSGIPKEIIYKSLLDSQMAANILKYPEECQMAKFFGILGDNLFEYQSIHRLNIQEGVLVNILEFLKSGNRLIDLELNLITEFCYQIKNVTFANKRQQLKTDFNNPTEVQELAKSLIDANAKKYFTVDRLKLVLNLETATPEDSLILVNEIRKMYPALKDRVLFIMPQQSPITVCSTEEKTTLISKILKYTKDVSDI